MRGQHYKPVNVALPGVHRGRRDLLSLLITVGMFSMAGAALAVLVVHSMTIAVAVTALIVLAALYLGVPMVIVGAAVPSVFFTWRLAGLGASGISFADLFLLVGTVSAAFAVDWHRPGLRRLLLVVAAYAAILVPVVAAHPTRSAVLELMHRMLLMGGSLTVGTVLAQHQLIPRVLRVYLVVAASLAVAAIGYSLTHGFSPAYPLGLNKNFLGDGMVLAEIVVLVAPGYTGIPVRFMNALRVLLLLGLLASHSRGSGIALAAGLILWGVRSRPVGLRSPLLYLAAAIMIFLTVLTFKTSSSSDYAYTSVGSRSILATEGMQFFEKSPVFGQGIRFYLSESTKLGDIQNIAVEVLAESGVVGAAGFIVLLVGGYRFFSVLKGPLGTVALLLFVARFAHGLTDVYWLAGATSLPWIVAGMALGTGEAATLRSGGSASAERLALLG